MSSYKLTCKVLSPVHIGTGEQIEPFEYVINDFTFYRIDLSGFLSNLSEKESETFYRLSNNNDINGLRKFITGTVDLDKYSLFSAQVSDTVNSLYHKKLGDINNQLLVNPLMRSELNQKVYIPGSSLKGAIRTGIVSGIARDKKFEKGDEKKFIRNFESVALNYHDAKFDPFKTIKIRDAYLTDSSTRICEVYNMGKEKSQRGDRFKSMQMINEVTKSAVAGDDLEFATEVIINEELQTKSDLSYKFTIEDIVNSCNTFYHDKLIMEGNRFYTGTPVEEASEKLLNYNFGSDEFLVRVGRFSQVESVTVDVHRKPRTMRDPRTKRPRGWGNTRNICEKKYPCGWIKVRISSEPVIWDVSAVRKEVMKDKRARQPETPVETKPTVVEEKPLEKMIDAIRMLQPTDAGRIGSVINDAFAQLETDDDKRAFARFVKEHMGKAFRKSKARKKLKDYLE